MINSSFVRPYEVIRVHGKALIDMVDLSMLDVIGDSLDCTWSNVIIDAEIVEDYYGTSIPMIPSAVFWGCHDADNNILDLRTPGIAYKPANLYGRFVHWTGAESVGKVTYNDNEGRYYGISLLGADETQVHCSKEAFTPMSESELLKWILTQQARGIEISNLAAKICRNHLQKSFKL